MPLFGRTKITAKYENFTTENAVEQLNAALSVHRRNRTQIKHLYEYYKGNTPILRKSKSYRQEVNNRVGVATAQEIVAFYTGYIVGEPIAYIRHDSAADNAKEIGQLNDWCRMARKASCDIDIANWAFICGTAYRACMEEPLRTDETPFSMCALDPMETFVAYSAVNSDAAVYAVNHRREADGTDRYVMYSNDLYVVTDAKRVLESGVNAIGVIPIVEYPANPMRIGVYEPVIPLLDALETIQSSRVDAVQQEADSVLAILGADVGDDEAAAEMADQLQKLKMLVLPVGSDAKYITAPLRQSEIQTLYDSVYTAILTITGVPNRNGGSSTSDTGQASYLRDGWATAESHAKQFEGRFKDSEVLFLRCAMAIARIKGQPVIPVRDIDVKFPRRYSENVLLRVQALQVLLTSGISIEDALPMVSLVSDPLDVAMRNKDRVDKLLFNENENNTETESENAEEDNLYGAYTGEVS